MAVELVCQGCGEVFEAARRSAKWCSDRCRKAASRSGSSEGDGSAPAEASETGLVGSVRADLEAAGRAGTFYGQLAIQLAGRLSDPDESGISSLSKELRTVMAAALDGAVIPDAEDKAATVADEEPDDEVTKARRQREQARQAAGLA